MRYLGACPSEKEMVEQILPDVRWKLECVLCWNTAASLALHVAVLARLPYVACVALLRVCPGRMSRQMSDCHRLWCACGRVALRC